MKQRKSTLKTCSCGEPFHDHYGTHSPTLGIYSKTKLGKLLDKMAMTCQKIADKNYRGSKKHGAITERIREQVAVMFKDQFIELTKTK